MTNEELAAIRERMEAATPGTWEHAYHEGDSLDELAAFFRKALAFAPEQLRIEMVTTGLPDETGICLPDAVTTAITGNGPRAEANAAFIAHAHEDVNTLLAENERLRAELTKFQTPYYLRLEERNQELSAENERLRAALEAVEYADMESRCPWCGNWYNKGHAPNCQRQAALGR